MPNSTAFSVNKKIFDSNKNDRFKKNEMIFRLALEEMILSYFPIQLQVTIDYGVLDLALVGDYSQIDLFGTTINLCSKINSSSSLLQMR